MLAADVLVLNHTLFFMQLGGVQEEAGGGLLFKNDFVIFDEAHTVERVASRHIGLSVSSAQLRYSLQRLWNPADQKRPSDPPAQRPGAGLVERGAQGGGKFFAAIEQACDRHRGEAQPEAGTPRGWSELRDSPARPGAGQPDPADAKFAPGNQRDDQTARDKDTAQELTECNRRLGELRDGSRQFL